MEKRKRVKTKGIKRRDFLKVASIGLGASFIGFPNVVLGKEPSPIKIGIVEPMTGPQGARGEETWRGYKIAAEFINADGGIKSLGGAKLELIRGDTESKPEVGMSQTERLIREGAVAISGAYQSAVTFATTQVAEKHHTPHVVPVSNTIEILKRGFKYIFRTAQNSDMSGRDHARYVGALAKKMGKENFTAVLIYEDSIYGKTVMDSVRKYAKLTNYLKILEEIPYQSNTTDLTMEITKAKAAKPEILVPCSYVNDGILMTKTMYEQRFDCLGVIGCASTGHVGTTDLQALKMLSEYLMDVSTDLNYRSPVYKRFAQRYKQLYKEEITYFPGCGFSTIVFIADALERAASRDREKLREAMAATKNFTGHINSMGPYQFDETGQNVNAMLIQQQILGQQIHIVQPDEYKTHEIVFPVPKWSERKL